MWQNIQYRILIMKVREILEAVRGGEIVLDFAGHQVNATKERLLEEFDEVIGLSNGYGDGTWGEPRSDETLEIVNLKMREHYKDLLDHEVEQEGIVVLSFCSDGAFCFGCGKKIKWVLTGNKIQLRNYFTRDEVSFKGKHVNHAADYVCPYAKHKPTKGEINVASKLIFVNFFKAFEDDTPNGQKYASEYSLNHSAGRRRITEFKAQNQNIVYGQMGNMSVGIYVNEAKDSIIVGPAYHPAETEEYESEKDFKKAIKEPIFLGYKMKRQTISLSVWRWEATDLKTLGKENYDALKAEEYMDRVEVNVPHGIWEFEHYYDTQSHENKHLYSLLKLKK